MLNGKELAIETHLGKSFEEGYANAATALSLLIQSKAFCGNFHHSRNSFERDRLSNKTFIKPEHSQELITTEVFGDVSGKSYLLINSHEVEILTRGVISGDNPSTQKIEFLKELDNILSAAVITKLSNSLGVKMYGNIPQWVGPLDSGISDRIRNDFHEETASTFISSAYFSLDQHPEVRPLFIWVMNGKILQFEQTSHAKL